jgi:hypothetical protein
VNDELFATSPSTVRENGPEDTLEGTIAVIAVSVQVVATQLVPFSETVLLP